MVLKGTDIAATITKVPKTLYLLYHFMTSFPLHLPTTNLVFK